MRKVTRKQIFNSLKTGSLLTGKNISFWQLAILMLVTGAYFVNAQKLTSRPDRGVNNKGSYQTTDIDAVSLQNGSVSLQIPLASLPPVAGGKLSYTLSASYNSKLWNGYSKEAEGQTSQVGCKPKYTTAEIGYTNAGGGWQIGGGYQLFFRDAHEDYDYLPADSEACYGYDFYFMQGKFFKPMIRMPDGSEHELRMLNYYPTYDSMGQRDHLRNYYKAQSTDSYGGVTFSSSTRMYSTDGSFITVVVNPPTDPVRWTAYLKDGTQIISYANGEQRIRDTNGNSILHGAGFVRDEQTTGREIKWSSTTHNGQLATKVEYQTVGGSWQSVMVVWGPTSVQGKLYKTTSWNPQGGEFGGGDVCYVDKIFGNTFNVVREIILPATEQGVSPQKFTFAYNSDTTSQASSYVNWACNSTSENYYRTVSHGLGELSDVTTPTGAHIKYNYRHDGTHGFTTLNETSVDEAIKNVITSKVVTHDGTTDTWQYNIDTTQFATGGSVTNPDGSTHSETFYAVNTNNTALAGENGLGGLSFRTKQSGKIITERKWILLGGDLLPFGSPTQKITHNPAVDTEYTSLLDDSGNRVKMTAKKFLYDYNGELLQTIEYDWFDPSLVTYTSSGYTGIPAGVPSSATVLRTTNNGYYNQAPDAASANAFHRRSVGTSTVILGAPKETKVMDGTVEKSKTQFSYDGQAYDTAPTIGNLTKVAAWDNSRSTWNETISAYNSYGNVISITDPRGAVTQIFYEDSTHAMPTKTIVDPQNGTGQQITTTVYDFHRLHESSARKRRSVRQTGKSNRSVGNGSGSQ
jgi:hypothetical protein